MSQLSGSHSESPTPGTKMLCACERLAEAVAEERGI